MAYSVGQSGVANYVNTKLTTVTRVVADGGMGGSGEVAVGGSSRVAIDVPLSLNTSSYFLNITSLTGYVSGKTDVTITVGSNVYVYGDTYGGAPNAGIEVVGGASADTIKIINNGYIVGAGGNSGAGTRNCAYYSPEVGQPAIRTSSPAPLTVVNNSGAFIAGGGGGGGGGGQIIVGAALSYFPFGGAGAGGGSGNASSGGRGVPPGTGANGTIVFNDFGCGDGVWDVYGGNGGFNFNSPITGGSLGTLGVGTDYAGIGGKAGGSGAVSSSSAFRSSLAGITVDNNGGSTGNAPTVTNITGAAQGGGGGGFGGAGAQGDESGNGKQLGEVGGYAVKKSGSGTVSTSGAGTYYGAIGV